LFEVATGIAAIWEVFIEVCQNNSESSAGGKN